MSKLSQLKRYLDRNEFGAAAELVATEPALLCQRFSGQSALLDLYARNCQVEKVKWLCDQMQIYGSSVDLHDDNHFSTIQIAYLNNRKESVGVLLPYTAKPNLRQWLVQRQLICIIGANFLMRNQLEVDPDIARTAESGQGSEAAHIFLSAIAHLMAVNQRYQRIQKILTAYFELSHVKTASMASSKIRSKVYAKEQARVIFNSGYVGHMITFALQRQTRNNFELSFYDANEPEYRNTFLCQSRLMLNGDHAVIRRINVPAAKLKEIIDELMANKNEPKEVVLAWLAELPQRLNNQFRYDQKILNNVHTFEKNRCYWENARLAVCDLFIDEFGVESGMQEYNRLMAFIHSQVIKNFKVAYADSVNEQALARLDRVIANKLSPPSILNGVAKLVLIILAYAIGVVLLSVGIAAFSMPIAPFGMLASVSSIVAGLFLTTAYFSAPIIAKFIATTCGLSADTVKPLKLVGEDKKEKHNERFTTRQVAAIKPSSGFFKKTWQQMQTIWVEPVREELGLSGPMKEFAMKTYHEDLNELWPLPAGVHTR